MPLNVALFITCLNDQFYPHLGIAMTKLLERFGCTVHFPSEQTCCGQPFFNNGYDADARELGRRMIEIFEPYPYVVTLSGSCCAMVRRQYPKLFEADPAYRHGCQKLASRTYDFMEFLDRVLRVDTSAMKLPTKRTVTYHYCCHLRELGLMEEPVRMLRQMGNVDYRPMEKADQCCGFGGTFAVKYPAINGAIVAEKVACIAATGAEITICNDAGCALNISGACHRMGVRTRVMHMAELMAEALGIQIGAW